MNDSETKITFSWPSVINLTDLRKNIEEVSISLGAISPEKPLRFKIIKETYENFTLVHIDYVHLLANLRDAVVSAQFASNRNPDFYPGKPTPAEILDAAREEFKNQRKVRNCDRAEIKSRARSTLAIAVDRVERNSSTSLCGIFSTRLPLA